MWMAELEFMKYSSVTHREGRGSRCIIYIICVYAELQASFSSLLPLLKAEMIGLLGAGFSGVRAEPHKDRCRPIRWNARKVSWDN